LDILKIVGAVDPVSFVHQVAQDYSKS